MPLSIAVTTSCTLACILTVPALLGLLAGEYLPAGFELPLARMAKDISLYLMAPLVLGMLVKRVAPERAPAVTKYGVRGSVALILVITAISLGSGRIQIAEYGFGPPAIIVLFALSLTFLTPQIARLFGRYDDEAVALSVEVVVRNVGIALLLVNFFFPGEAANGHVLFTCLFYAGLSTPFVLPLLFAHRKGMTAVPFRAARPRPDPAPL